MVDSGISPDYARTFSLMTLIVGNVILVLVNRSNTKYLIHIFKEKGSKARFYINGLALIMLFAVDYIYDGYCKNRSKNLIICIDLMEYT